MSYMTNAWLSHGMLAKQFLVPEFQIPVWRCTSEAQGILLFVEERRWFPLNHHHTLTQTRQAMNYLSMRIYDGATDTCTHFNLDACVCIGKSTLPARQTTTTSNPPTCVRVGKSTPPARQTTTIIGNPDHKHVKPAPPATHRLAFVYCFFFQEKHLEGWLISVQKLPVNNRRYSKYLRDIPRDGHFNFIHWKSTVLPPIQPALNSKR